MFASHHQLGVENDVNTKNQRSKTCVDNIDDIVARKYKGEKSKHHQAYQSNQ